MADPEAGPPRGLDEPGESPTQLQYQDDAPVLTMHTAVLRVVAGPDAGVSCPLTIRRARVGTARDVELVLTDPLVSRQHLELRGHDHGYLVSDLGSTNGTFFRGARIREVVLGVGSQLNLGSTTLRLEQGAVSRSSVAAKESFGQLIGTSPAMQAVYGVLSVVAPSDVTVLLEGETGTGKEMVAEAIHRQSPRADKPLVVVDCGSLPAGLIESELFGHERGAFTGAVSSHEGSFERARGGTVFLDEIGELPVEMQTRLLRALDRREVRRVGGSAPRKIDLRLVAATHRNLADDVAAGRFRQDLYYRLAVVRVRLPSLRKRREDIPVLARHFLLQSGCPDPDRVLTPPILQTLLTRRWPGNVRELRNVVERAVVLADGDELAISRSGMEAPPTSASESAPSVPDRRWLGPVLPAGFLALPYKVAKENLLLQFEALFLGRLIKKHGGNLSHMAQEAGIDRQLIRKLLRKHGLRLDGDDDPPGDPS